MMIERNKFITKINYIKYQRRLEHFLIERELSKLPDIDLGIQYDDSIGLVVEKYSMIRNNILDEEGSLINIPVFPNNVDVYEAMSLYE